MRGDYLFLLLLLSTASVTMLYFGSQTDTTYVYDTASNLQKRFRTKLEQTMPACCKALTKECLSCAAGMLVHDFCDRHKGEYGCMNVTVTPAPVEDRHTTTPKPIVKRFKRNYRAKYIAQAKQDRYVDTLFKDKKLSKGLFVEFGGLKGDEYSNTWYFEKAYNWRGIMIEAEKKFIPHLKKVRPNCKIYNNAVCPTGVKEVTFASSKIAGWSGILNSYEDPRWHAQVGDTFEVKCVDLNTVLKENNFNHVDYMTVDTEGSEIEILETFQFHSFDITYIQVERNVKTQKQRERRDYLIQLMKKNGYITKKVFDIGNHAVDILFEKKNYNTVLISTDRTKTFGIKKRIQQSLNYFTETYDEVKKQFPDVNIHVDHKTNLYRGIRVKEWRPRKNSYDFVTRYAALIYANTLKSYSTDLLVFEDDLFISDNLRERIDWAVGFLYSSGITNFIIDCHNVAGRKVKKHHETLFEIKFAYATQCMYYSSTAISKVVQSIETKKVPYDHAIRDSNIPCYAFDKSMIYHRGEKSTGLAGLHISKVRNPSFQKEVKIELKAGLGNQMFQYTSGIYIAKRQGATLCGSHLKDGRKQYFNLEKCKINHLRSKERGFAIFDEKMLKSDFPTEYLQSYKYFLDENMKKQHRQWLGVTNTMENTIGIHVRLTDHTTLGYLSLPSYDWFNSILKHLNKPHTRIYLFSDDIERAIQLLPKFDFIHKRRDEKKDMALLASCENIILSRGTFGWWAGYLSNGQVWYRPEFVTSHNIARGKFKLNDYYLPSWNLWHAPVTIDTREPDNNNDFWKNNVDRKYMKSLYPTLKYDNILDVGFRGYNKDCKKMLPIGSKYYQIDPTPPTAMDNDGYLVSTIEDVQTKYPSYRSKFDIILDFGVLGWKITGEKINIETYIQNILFLLVSDGTYILKIDRPYTVNRDKYIYPHFELYKEDNVGQYTFLHLKRKQTKYKKCVIVCHPDDESIWAGDILDSDTHVIVVTDANSSGLHVKRKQSLSKAMKLVKSSWEMWDFPETLDYKRSNTVGWSNEGQRRLIDKLNTLHCETVYTHGVLGEYGHIDHRNLHKAVVKSDLTNIYVFDPKLNYGTPNEFNLKEKCKESQIHNKLLNSYEQDGSLGNAGLFRPICQRIKQLYPYRHHTLVTAYFDIPSKFSHQTYLKWMENLLSVTDAMIIFTEEKLVDYIKKRRLHAPTHIVTTTIREFKSFKDYGETYWNDQHEKDPESGLHRGYQLYCVWNEKANFIKQSIDINPFKSHFFAWIDIGYLRTTSYNNKLLIRTIPSDINENRVLLLDVRKEIRSPNLYIGGGFIGGYIAGLTVWHEKFYNNLLTYKDQPIMTKTCKTNPSLCYLVKSRKSKWDSDPWFYMAGLLHEIPKYKTYICDKIHQMVYDIHDAAEKNDLWYTLLVGSALAATRHHDGCSTDIDGDIEMLSISDATSLANKLRHKYHVVSSNDKITDTKDGSAGDEWYTTTNREIPFRIFLCDKLSFPYVDIWVNPTKSKYYKIRNGYKIKGREECYLGSVKTFCPKNIVEYLEHKYPSGWYVIKTNGVHRQLTESGKSITGCKNEIDVVIPWSGEPENDVSGVNRDDGIIKYTIKSIQKYMPWVRYIIIYANDANMPSFLKGKPMGNVRLYNRCDNFIDNQCPTVNTFAIYANIFRIPYLSDRYIVMDDDIIINRPLSSHDFFNGKKIKFRYSRKIRDIYPKNIIKSKKIKDLTKNKWVEIPEVLPKQIKMENHHLPMGNIKSAWVQFYTEYKEWFKFVSSHKKRFCFLQRFHDITLKERGNLNGACYQEDPRAAYYWYYMDNVEYGGLKENFIGYNDITNEEMENKLQSTTKTFNINDSALWDPMHIVHFDKKKYNKRKSYVLSVLDAHI